MGVALPILDVKALGREFELLETMRAFAHEMHEAVQGTPTARQLEELFNREPPAGSRSA